jgi:hypothetical protein
MGKWQFTTVRAWWWLYGMAIGWLHASNGGALLILYTNGLILPEWDLFVPPMVEQSIQITHSYGEMAVSHLWSMVVAVRNDQRVAACIQCWCFVDFVFQRTHLTSMEPISTPHGGAIHLDHPILWGNCSFPSLEHAGGCVEWPEGSCMRPMVVLC